MYIMDGDTLEQEEKMKKKQIIWLCLVDEAIAVGFSGRGYARPLPLGCVSDRRVRRLQYRSAGAAETPRLGQPGRRSVLGDACI